MKLRRKLLATALLLLGGICLNNSLIVNAETITNDYGTFEINEGVLTSYTGECSEVIIPDSVTSIGDEAFSNKTAIKSITMSDNVISIGNKTFSNCSSLESITFSNSLISIGDSAFSDCSSLTSIIIPNTVTSLGSSFSGCTNLQYISVPNIACVDLNLPEDKNILIVSNTDYSEYASSTGNLFMYKSISKNDIELLETYYDYTGDSIEPKVTISNGSTNLDSSYYEVSYTDNVYPGTAAVIITGKEPFNTTPVTVLFYINYLEPSIITQPIDVSTKLGQDVTFTIEAEGVDVKYQWYMTRDLKSDGSLISNATNSSYTIPADSLTYDLHEAYFYCEVYDNYDSIIRSDLVQLDIIAKPTKPTIDINVSQLDWFTSEFTISLIDSMIDDSNEEVGYKYSIDNEETWINYTEPIVWNIDTNNTTLLAYAYNTSYPDIKSEIVSYAINYDSTSPVINEITTKDYSLVINATDATSGIKEYSLLLATDKSVISTFRNNSLPLTENGTYIVAVTDNAGNTTYSEPITINQTLDTCIHNQDIIKNAVSETCCTPGYAGDLYCSLCDNIQAEGANIPATNEHITEIRNAVNATCIEEGYTGDTYCVNSDKLLSTGTSIDMIECDSLDLLYIEEPTCCDYGYSGDICCSMCGEIQEEGYDIEPTGEHELELKDSREATCISYGYTGNMCCKTTGYVVEEGELIDKLLHNTDTIKNAKEATCCETGYTGDLYCSNGCDECQITGTLISATNNHKEEIRNAIDPKCNSLGYTGDIYCANSDKLLATGESMEMTDHDKELIKNAIEPTCCTEGYTGDLHCSGCEEFQESGNTIEPTGEHITEIRNHRDPSCIDKGYTGDTWCTIGNKLIQAGEEIGYTSCNKTVVKNEYDPTCCKEGYTGDLYCSVCDTFQAKGDSIPVTGEHTTIIKNAEVSSCIEDGYTGDTWCTVGNKLLEYGEVIKADKCNKELVKNFKEPTCCSTGYTGDLYCTGCKILQEKGSISEATHKHDEDLRNAKSATCTETGYTGDIYCKYSGYLITKGSSIDKLIHDKDIIKDAKEPTCGLSGFTGDKYCSKCNALQENGTIIEPTNNHNYDMSNGLVTKEATTDTEGSIEYKCTNCDSKYTETIAKLPIEKPTVDNTATIKAAKNKKATISKVTNSKGKKLVVKLKKANGYNFEIKVSTDKKFKKSVKTYKTSKTSYTIKKLKKNKTYYVRVRTYKKIDSKTYYGKWSKVKSIKIKK